MRNFQVWVKGSGTNERAVSSACIAPIFAHIPENKPKTSTIEQIRYRWEPKISPLQRVTLQNNSDKNPKIRRKFAKKIQLKILISNENP